LLSISSYFYFIGYGMTIYILFWLDNDKFSYRRNCFNFVHPISFCQFIGIIIVINILDTFFRLYRWLYGNLIRMVDIFPVVFWGLWGLDDGEAIFQYFFPSSNFGSIASIRFEFFFLLLSSCYIYMSYFESDYIILHNTNWFLLFVLFKL